MGALAQEVAPFGITTTIVNPGFFRTGLASPESPVRSRQSGVVGVARRRGRRLRRLRRAQRQWWQAQDGQQPGDPDKLARAVVVLAEETPPPTRFIAGADVIALAERKIAELQAEVDSHRALSTSLIYDDLPR